MTKPIMVEWQATEKSLVTHSDGASDTISFSWSEPGTKVVFVSISNTDDVVPGTHSAVVNAPPVGLVVTGPSEATIGTSYTLTATVSPVTVTAPIPYLWRATDNSLVVQVRGLSDPAAFAWRAPGPQSITVTAQNVAGAVTSTRSATLNALPVGEFADTTVFAVEDAIRVGLEVVLGASSEGMVKVDYVALPGTAPVGGDFQDAEGKLTFASGETSQHVAIYLVEDEDGEEDETVAVMLSNPDAAEIGGNDSATLTNLGNDVSAELSVSQSVWPDTATSEEEFAYTLTIETSGPNADPTAQVVSVFSPAQGVREVNGSLAPRLWSSMTTSDKPCGPLDGGIMTCAVSNVGTDVVSILKLVATT